MDLVVRNRIQKFAELLMKVPTAQMGDSELCPLIHKFAEGMYIREIFIPAGTVIVGKIHRHEHPNFLLQGEVTVFTEQEGREHLVAPCSMISPAGVQRVVLAHTDVIWTTVHLNPTNTRDLEKIEEYVIAKSYDELPDLVKEALCLGA